MRHQYKAHAQGYKPAHKPAHKLHKLAVRRSPILVLRIITCLLGTQTLWLWRVRSFQSWSRPSELGWYNDPKSAKVKIYMLILLLQYFFMTPIDCIPHMHASSKGPGRLAVRSLVEISHSGSCTLMWVFVIQKRRPWAYLQCFGCHIIMNIHI